MSTLKEFLRAVAGLFVDDELLAVGVLVVVGVTSAAVHILGVGQLAAGAMLLLGNILVLIMGVVRRVARKS